MSSKRRRHRCNVQTTTTTMTERVIIRCRALESRTHAHSFRDINLNNCPCKRTSFRFVSLGKTRRKIALFYVRIICGVRVCVCVYGNLDTIVLHGTYIQYYHDVGNYYFFLLRPLASSHGFTSILSPNYQSYTYSEYNNNDNWYARVRVCVCVCTCAYIYK